MSTQVRLGIVIAVVAAGAIAFLMTHKKSGTAPSVLSPYGDLKPPKLIELRALGPNGERKLDGKPQLQTDEVLDFQLEVEDQSFVYVFREQGGALGLAWGHPQVEDSWNPGVYAPSWVDTRGGMAFAQGGTVRVFAIASPAPQPDAASWNLQTLENLKAKCPQCGVTTLEVAVAQK